MTTPEGFNGDPVITTYPVNDRPGVRFDFGDDEFVVAEQFRTGFGLTWTTDKTAAEVFADYTAMGTEGLSSSYSLDGEETNDRDRSVGERIVSDLEIVGDACILARLRREGVDDHIAFNSRKLAGGNKNTVAVLARFLEVSDVKRKTDVETAIKASATPAVLSRVDWILDQVIPNITSGVPPSIRAELDAMLERMQDPANQRAVHDAFSRKPHNTD